MKQYPNDKYFGFWDNLYVSNGNPSILYRLDVKAYGTEAVVARNHCAMRIFHPPVVKISPAHRKLFDKRTHALPRAFAKALRTLCVHRHELVAHIYVASVLDGIFIQIHKVFIFRFSDCRNSNFSHTEIIKCQYLCVNTKINFQSVEK